MGNTRQYNPEVENPYAHLSCSRCGVCTNPLYVADEHEEKIIINNKDSYYNKGYRY